MNRDIQIRYQDGIRLVKRYSPINDYEYGGDRADNSIPLRRNGVYWITGMGGLATIFARHLIEAYQARIIFSGRSELDAGRQAALAELSGKGSLPMYLRGDVSLESTVRQHYEAIKAQYPHVHGVIHAAGIVDDGLLISKTARQIREVLAPKINGTIALDSVTRAEPLDFFVCFSSLAAVNGNVGQSDYAFANGFMDGFVSWRNGLVAANQRSGRSVSINWPLWKEGGLRISDEQLKDLENTFGFRPLETAEGIEAFNLALQTSEEQLVLLPTAGAVARTGLVEQTLQYLKTVLSEEMKIPAAQINSHAPFEKFGIDSIMVVSVTRRLEKTFGPLSKTLLFEYLSLSELADYFASHHVETLSKLFEPSLNQPDAKPERANIPSVEVVPSAPDEQFSLHEPIAIVGLAGRYPAAPTLDVFWENLKNGVDAVTEIPASRWNYDGYIPGATPYGKWAGLIDQPDHFDAPFFNISPREAVVMDPQERLLLQTVWHLLEDAGYTRASLNRVTQRQVGVFIGVMNGDYQLYGAEYAGRGQGFALNSSYASLANRVSYFFDFHGPSIAVDTMCSSSLTAIHLACQSLILNESQCAVAGGVNLLLHPNKFVLLALGNFTSSDGRCRSFGDGGDGYVPGEGVGAVLLKRLSAAEADGDHIYGVIRGTSINHGGKTNGYSVPNPNSQSSVVADALSKAKVPSETISYVEAHGTGTSLGDPIEFRGLVKAFGDQSARAGNCPIGSVKSNIGHLESAAGIAGLTKILLQLKHHQLVPSLHSKSLNSNIDFTGTPFVVQQERAAWERPPQSPRRACLSSFGAGGANAHLVVEEAAGLMERARVASQRAQLIVVSAKTQNALQQNCENLAHFIESEADAERGDARLLSDVAHTLRVGREAMKHRVAIVATTVAECVKLLREFVAHGANDRDSLYGEVKNSEPVETPRLLSDDLRAIARAWVAGALVDWNGLSADAARRRPLPGYAFQTSRLWFDKLISADTETAAAPAARKLVLKKLADQPAAVAQAEPAPVSYAAESIRSEVYLEIRTRLAQVLFIQPSEIDEDIQLSDLGLDSILGVELIKSINDLYGLNIKATRLYDYSTIRQFTDFVTHERLQGPAPETAATPSAPELPDVVAWEEPVAQKSSARYTETMDVAIVGISCRFPGANNAEEFWRNLSEGRGSITEIPPDRWAIADFYDADPSVPGKTYCKFGGYLSGIDEFDAAFFNISAVEAEVMDPQQRLFLQEAWHAVEDAGYAHGQLSNVRCGVFVGAGQGDYGVLLQSAQVPLDGRCLLGNSQSVLAGRISYFLNLKGASVAIDTACSSSLVAIHEAANALARGECELALAGGVSVLTTANLHVMCSKAGMLSPDGQCRTFDQSANGFVPAEGVAAILLKPLADAVRDRDHVYGVIKASGTNQDGRTNGLTAPNRDSQVELMRTVYEKSGLDPKSIQYIEAHGTGTKLGDPIEVEALTRVFANDGQSHPIPIGSVKTNVGHTLAAAGMASVIKVVLCLKHRMLVPSLNFSRLNEHIERRNPFVVNTDLRPWNRTPGVPRRAAVSSFGFSGTNCHIVIEEPPTVANREAPRHPYELFVLSARTQAALQRQMTHLAAWIEQNGDHANSGDLAYTLLHHRATFPFRAAFVASDLQQALRLLTSAREPGSERGIVIGRFDKSEQPAEAFLELLGKQLLTDLPALVGKSDEYKEKLQGLAELFVKGYDLPWERLYSPESCRKVVLPLYPFEKKRYWFDSYGVATNVAAIPEGPVAGKPKLQLRMMQAAAASTSASPAVERSPGPAVSPARSAESTSRPALLTEVTAEVRRLVTESLHAEDSDISDTRGFLDLGMDSILAVELISRINKTYGIAVKTTVLFDYSTIKSFSQHLCDKYGEQILANRQTQSAESLATPQARPIVQSRTTARALILRQPGQIRDVALQSLDISEPGAGAVQIEVRAFSLNFGDLLCVKGLYPTQPDYPFVPGFEVAGTISKVGPDVENFAVGDPVIAVTGSALGGHSTVLTVPSYLVVRKPENVSFEMACAFPIVYLTALYTFEKAQVRPGEKVLIQTAAGGVGLIAVQMAQQLGAEIFATAGSDEKLAYLAKRGVKHLINYSKEDFAQRILDVTHGYGVDVVLNTLSGNGIQKGLNLLAPEGRYVEVAMMGLKTACAIDLSHLVDNQVFHSVDLRRLMATKPDKVAQYLEVMRHTLETGAIQPTVGRMFSLNEIQDAYAHMENRSNIGKIVVTLSGDQADVPPKRNSTEKGLEPIAVIGMSGRFPGATGVEEFWNNIKNGVNSIVEVPSARWNVADYFDPVPSPNKVYCKWGGFLDNVDQFDPLFFNMSPKEARFTDPQQRFFLEESWRALESAGYATNGEKRQNCGVFVGVVSSDYLDNFSNEDTQSREAQTFAFMGNSNSILSGRISYLLNLTGPCVAVDTACSSSLVTVHMACESLRSGESDMALAGGVCIFTTPKFYVFACQAGMLSADGQCKTFDENANGFVPGEGVGVVVLKRLSDAIRDGDHIWGVIRGSGVNQDGRTSGITAPSSLSQMELEKKVYDRFEIDPSSIGMIEAHGTGTKLGDPIEIEALTNAFRSYTSNQQFCALGSVKTNIGHLAAAAGVAGLIKALLSLRARQIPPSLNLTQLNPYLELANGPFYVNTQLQEWKAPLDRQPRRAAVSSFGYSGTNCHLIVEETPDPEARSRPTGSYFLIVVSAQSEKSLRRRLTDLQQWLRENAPIRDLGDLAYTLAVGRAHFDWRWACVASDEFVLSTSISDALGQEKMPRPVRSRTTEAQGAASREIVDRLLLESLAERYRNGAPVEFRELYNGRTFHRLPLPTYPFDHQRYWPDPKKAAPLLHPLVLDADAYYFADHCVRDLKVLPGAASIELVRAAAESITGKRVSSLRDILWLAPVVALESRTKLSVLFTADQTDLKYEVHPADTGSIVHSRGRVVFGTAADTRASFAVADVQQRCAYQRSGEDIYRRFSAVGLRLGPAFRTVTHLWRSATEALGRIELPVSQRDAVESYVLHPSLLDGVLQTVAGIMDDGRDDAGQLYVPFSIREITIGDRLPAVCYSYARLLNGKSDDGLKRFDVEVVDEAGKLVLAVRDFLARQFQDNADRVHPVRFYTTKWMETPPTVSTPSELTGTVCIVGPLDDRTAALKERLLSLPDSMISVCEFDTRVIAPGEVIHELTSRCRPPFHLITIWQDGSGTTVLPIFQFARSMAAEAGVTGQWISLNFEDEVGAAIANATYGLGTSLALEKPSLRFKLLSIAASDTGAFARQCIDELLERDSRRTCVRYANGKRLTRSFIEIEKVGTNANLEVRPQGTYLITGGFGAVGRIVAGHFVDRQPDIRLVITGRSPLNEQMKAMVREWEAKGTTVHYQQADIADYQSVQRLRAAISERFGPLHGVVHCAGIRKDALLVNKRDDDISSVLGPKVNAARYLDELTQSEPLDFFVLFSSIAGPLGNWGQADYSFANCYLDDFADRRNRQRESGRRSGRTVSINWPYWADGGMSVSPETKKFVEDTLGLFPLSSAEGLRSFDHALSLDKSPFMVIKGNAAKYKRVLNLDPAPVSREPSGKSEPDPAEDVLLERVMDWLTGKAATLLNLEPETIDPDKPMNLYGFDSISLTSLSNQLNQELGIDSTPATFFEHSTIAALSSYLLQEYREKLAAVVQVPEPVPVQIIPATPLITASHVAHPLEPIAIIGMAGIMPQSANLDEFWRNLEQGKDLITRIPADRWNWESIYGDPLKDKNKTNITYGGFIPGIDEFDADFFEVSRREAELMDPQQRLYMQNVIHTIENAGYAPSYISGTRTGIFVGVGSSDYMEVMQSGGIDVEAYASTGMAHSILPNRISYYLNARGPSEPVDTACSSALVAIHRAVESIRRGESEMAIAGGVNALLTPTVFISFSKAGMLSADGKCKTFDKSANGYVRGEGVGSVFLKPLSRAQRDGDQILAVIRGTRINHGGQANSLTAPNVKAQAELLEEVYAECGVDPASVSYIEAHGTGTSLGDPVEINGLKKAFQALYKRSNQALPASPYCGVGSVKSNIGHLETAAGIASVIKVVLAMKHQKLPPSIHFNQLNPYIKIDDSPFYIVDRVRDWTPTAGSILRAGVSSFGFGGVNSHVVMEAPPPTQRPLPPALPAYWIPLSAKTAEALRQKVTDLRHWLESAGSSAALFDVMFTLLAGRDHYRHRVSWIVSTPEQLLAALKDFEESRQSGSRSSHLQNLKVKMDRTTKAEADAILNARITQPNLNQHLPRLADLFHQGYALDWNALFEGAPYRRLALPVYPFERRRHWITNSAPASTAVAESYALHPMIDRNTSTLASQELSTRLTESRFYLAEHRVQHKMVLPGVAYLEMARAAGALSGIPNVRTLRNVVWLRPFVLDQTEKTISVRIKPSREQLNFEIVSTQTNGETWIHSQGVLGPSDPATTKAQRLDIASIKSRAAHTRTGPECYKAFANLGLQLGASFRSISQVWGNSQEALAWLELPGTRRTDFTQYELHPSILDGSLQSVTGIFGDSREISLHLPFSLGSITLLKPITPEAYAYVTSEGASDGLYRFRIQICDPDGNVLAVLSDFVARPYGRRSDNAAVETTIYQRTWKAISTDTVANATPVPEEWVFLNWDDSDLVFLATQWGVDRSALTAVAMPVDEQGLSDLISSVVQRGAAARQWTVCLRPQAEMFDSFYGLVTLVGSLIRQSELSPENLRVLYSADSESLPIHAAVAGWARSVNAEQSRVKVQLIERIDSSSSLPVLPLALTIDMGASAHIRIQDGSLWRESYEAITPSASPVRPIKKGKVYWITGGGGKLSTLLAHHLARQRAHVVLSGRSSLDPQLQAEGVVYLQADVTDKNSVEACYAQIKARFSRLDGVFHLAGVSRINKLLEKSRAEIESVLAPKIAGTVILDEVTQNDPLDFFVCFSSIAAIFGSAGQSDYAMANAFMDRFAHYRNRLVSEQNRSGATISLNWPVWRDGGMSMDPAVAAFLESTIGMQELATEEAFDILDLALQRQDEQWIVLKGIQAKISSLLNSESRRGREVRDRTSTSEESKALLDKLQKDLIERVATTVKADRDRIEVERDLSEFGFDSIAIMALTNQLNETYSLELSPSVFFEYTSIAAFSRYLLGDKRENIEQFFHGATGVSVVNDIAPEPIVSSGTRFLDDSVPTERTSVQAAAEPIAVIGMAATMPNSSDLADFWHNLAAGRNLISVVPRDRWDWKAFYGDPATEKNKTHVKWGGFMPDIDKFDAEFFEISPREAELMDPQQRIFMQAVWQTIQDAGYRSTDFAGTNTGLFVGVATSDYLEVVQRAKDDIEAHMSTGMSHSVLANRISYMLDIHGPSEPVDTACSSSLVAVHRAVESIRRGESEMAFAGGVNALLTPSIYISFSKAGMLAEDGQCKTFDDRANGYVRGEGVGVVLLKPLRRAIADGDHIYGVIKGTSINHGGNASSLTAPNPAAQANVILAAMKNAQVEPSSISYIEAHGTGTRLGDPVEIAGLKKAFLRFYEERNEPTPANMRCGIGSVKTNIGHLETAAGIAGMIKVLLGLTHRVIPASLNFKTLNSFINLQNSPFYIVEQTMPWPEPQTSGPGRRAGISSFGFGGVNAHVIVEEYVEALSSSAEDEPQLVVLSALNVDRLRTNVRNLLAYCGGHADTHFRDLAYTLQVGRDEMPQRLSVVAADMPQMVEKLTQWLQNGNANEVFVNYVKTTADGETVVRRLIENNKLPELAALWTDGVKIDFRQLKRSMAPKRVSLPPYAFEKKRVWVEEVEPAKTATAIESYSIEWETKPRSPELSTSSLPGTWIVVGRPHGIGKTVGEMLEAHEQTVIHVHKGAFFERLAPRTWQLDTNDPHAYQLLAEELSSEDFPKPIRVLVIHADDSLTPEDSDEQIGQRYAESGLNVLNIVRSLGRSTWVVTHNAVRVEQNDTVAGVFQSPLWGLARTLALEFPEQWGGIVDWDGSPDSLTSLIFECLDPDAEDQSALRKGQRYVPRLVSANAEVVPETLQIDPAASYLITGGLGFLGKQFAQALIEKGARNLLLLSRRESISNELKRELSELEGLGARVHFVRGDVANHEEMKSLMLSVLNQHPPLKGIIHAAGTIDYRPGETVGTEEYLSVIRPKVLGAWNLHCLTQNLSLDFFVMFSSIASVWGSRGQSAYAAGNHFMDSLSYFRRQRNLPATSINWGPWDGGGMASPEAQRVLEMMGIRSLEPDSAVQAGLLFIHTRQIQSVFASIEWPVFRNIYESRRKRPFLERIEVSSKLVATPDDDKDSIVAKLRSLPREEQEFGIRSHLNSLLSGVLGLIPASFIADDQDLLAMGLDSIMAMEMGRKIHQTFRVELKLNAFFERPTFGTLVELISSQLNPSGLRSDLAAAKDLNSEAFLDDGIVPVQPITFPSVIRSILLTGSTGFLGAFLLAELLEKTAASVFCLVRAQDAADGVHRIKANLDKYSLWKERYSSRVQPVPGDLSQPLLGLAPADFDNLAQTIDCIYHNGAVLNFVYPYSAIKPVNILGTHEVLRLACTKRTKPVHYVSTDAVFDSPRYYGQVLLEGTDPQFSDELDLGYTQSKWVAERIVRIARDRGIPVTIYRPPLIAGHSKTGEWYTDDFICRFLKGCIQLGCIPTMNSPIQISPVDYVSKAIVHISMMKESVGQAFHLINPNAATWTSVVQWFNEFGYPVRSVPYEEWEKALVQASQLEENHLRNMIPFFLNRWSNGKLTFPELSDRRAQLDCGETVRVLARSGISCAPMSKEQMSIYLKYFISIGFLVPPDQGTMEGRTAMEHGSGV